MSLRESWTRIRGTLRRDNTLEREMDREIAFHLEMAAQRNVERGMTPEAAMREARLAVRTTFENPHATRRARASPKT